MAAAVDKPPAYAQLALVARAGDLPTAPTPRPGTRPALAAEAGLPERLMIDSTHLKAHRTAASLLQKGVLFAVSAAPKAA